MRIGIRIAAILTAVMVLFSGCSGGGSSGHPEPAEPYPIPPFRDAVLHEEQAVTAEALTVDLSSLSEGYLALRARSEKQLKFQVECGEMKYNYTVPGDDTAVFLPINMGSGDYRLRLMENVSGNKYSCIWMEQTHVELQDEFSPFLVPSQLVPYGEDSQCVELARSLASDCGKDSDVVAAIYGYLVEHITYDHAKAASVQPGYLPDPDETLATGTGICFDYASLAAAMMRSLGIPCKLIMGYVDGSMYHAWNCFYLQDQGWVTVQIKAKPGIWQRVDITMAAGGTKTADLEDDSKYTTRYTY